MKILYECGDVFKAENINEYYIIACMYQNNFTLISLSDGCNFDSDIQGDEEYITECIQNEDLTYVGKAEDVIEIKCNK